VSWGVDEEREGEGMGGSSCRGGEAGKRSGGGREKGKGRGGIGKAEWKGETVGVWGNRTEGGRGEGGEIRKSTVGGKGKGRGEGGKGMEGREQCGCGLGEKGWI